MFLPGPGPLLLQPRENASTAGVASYTVTAADSIALVEALAGAPLALARSPVDSVTLTESTARTLAAPRAITDTITFVESVASQNGKTRACSDTLTFAESLARASLAVVRSGTDAITLAE